MPTEDGDRMDQPALADLEYQGRKRKTRPELFLKRMKERISPCHRQAGRERGP